jgi:hypothetical protein
LIETNRFVRDTEGRDTQLELEQAKPDRFWNGGRVLTSPAFLAEVERRVAVRRPIVATRGLLAPPGDVEVVDEDFELDDGAFAVVCQKAEEDDAPETGGDAEDVAAETDGGDEEEDE